MVERYPGQRSEYGGGDGSPALGPDGEFLDLPGIAAAPGERARLMRQAGLADYDPAAPDTTGLVNLVEGVDVSAMSFAEREAYEADLLVATARARERERLRAQSNGYIDVPETYVGESGEDNGVTTDMAETNASPEG